MSEFLTILVGQCGNQIGSVLLPEILREYGINETDKAPNKSENSANISSFFYVKERRNFNKLSDLKRAKVKARFMCVDMEEKVVSRLKQGKYRDLYENKCFITNSPGSGNNFAEGFYGHGPKYEDEILNTLTYHVEKADCLHGFLVILSAGGGTGSGLGTFILQLLQDNYPKIDRFVVCVYPTGTEDVITCPYNMAFASVELLNNASCVFPVENRAIFDILQRNSKKPHENKHINMFKPYDGVNSIIVDMLLHVTSGARFPGKLNLDMTDLTTNMVPLPKLNFLSTGLSPLTVKNDPNPSNKKQQKTEIFLTACSRNNHLIKIDPLGCRNLSLGVTLLARGNYVIGEMRTCADRLTSKLRYTAWSEKAISIALCGVAPRGHDCAIFAAFNSTALSGLFETIREQYVKLYSRKAHVHHYTEVPGFDFDNFQECLENLDDVINVYSSVNSY